MIGHGYLLDLQETMYIALKLISIFIIFMGMVLCLCITSTTSGKCQPMDISSKYECEGYQVRNLDCFGRRTSNTKILQKCTWTLGELSWGNVFTLVILQHGRKKLHCIKNISGTSAELPSLYSNINMTVYVFKESDPNCTAIFKGSTSLARCDPPYSVMFIRHLRELNVTVTWRVEDKHAIHNYSVRYKTQGSLLWDEPPVSSRDREKSTVKGLNSSLAYQVQIQCISNSMCSQCPWSDIYTVAPELTLPPTHLEIEDVKLSEKNGSRLLSLTWKSPISELVEGYKVEMRKSSGELLPEQMNTTHTKITLILSYSSYIINISAFNNASISPAVSTTIPLQEISSTGAERLHVTVNSNVSYTISWKDDLIKSCRCFAVEWYIRENKMAFKSFFEKNQNNHTISLTEPLEPYKRYTVTLHKRLEKSSCNLKHINSSESTYASVQFYLTEGSPVSPPRNISSQNQTLNSMALQWLPVLEEDLRGFLLGYVIHYIEYNQRTTGVEKNVTVGPGGSNSHVLENLKSGTVYRVQMSAVTSAGEGVRSAESYFQTHSQGLLAVSVVFVLVAVVMLCTLPLCLLQRVKAFFWPSIPNPGSSSAIEKINESHELVLLKPIDVEEWDTASLHKVNIGHKTLIEPLPSVFSTHPGRGSASEAACLDPFQIDAEDTSGSVFSDHTGAASADTRQNISTSPCNFLGDYTTMEMFQQAMPQSCPGTTAVASEATGPHSGEPDVTVTERRKGYVRQFSTSPEGNGCDAFYTVQ